MYVFSSPVKMILFTSLCNNAHKVKMWINIDKKYHINVNANKTPEDPSNHPTAKFVFFLAFVL